MTEVANNVKKNKEMVKCKYCDSHNVVKFGCRRGIQRWWCKDCQRKFVDNDALPCMRRPVRQVSAVLSTYYNGMPFKAIRRHLEQQYGNIPPRSTLRRWVARFTEIAINQASSYKPDVGDVWVADETVLKIGRSSILFWDIIDSETGFLLASHMLHTRTTEDAKILVEKAFQKAGKTPKHIITDKLQAYLDKIELASGVDIQHISAKGFAVQPNANLIAHFHDALEDRARLMKGMKKRDTARLLIDGWFVHYNFFGTDGILRNGAPAKKAGIDFPFKDWLDVVKSQAISNPKSR